MLVNVLWFEFRYGSFVNITALTCFSLLSSLSYYITKLVFLVPRRCSLFVTGSACLLLVLFVLAGLEYIADAATTSDAPTKNSRFGRKSKANADMIQDNMMLKEVANTLRTLSAYFTTTATINPPTACTVITVTTIGE